MHVASHQAQLHRDQALQQCLCTPKLDLTQRTDVGDGHVWIHILMSAQAKI